MLKNLIASKTRVTLLKTFFETPETEYYTRQLASRYNISVGTIHRELKKLTSFGILKTRLIGNLKLFSLNKQNPIHEELKNIIYKTEGVIKLVGDAMSCIDGVKVAFIYGSFAKGDERQDSDVDIFLIGDNINEDKLISNISNLEKLIIRVTQKKNIEIGKRRKIHLLQK